MVQRLLTFDPLCFTYPIHASPVLDGPSLLPFESPDKRSTVNAGRWPLAAKTSPMDYHYIIQLASYEESEDPEKLFVKEDDFQQARQSLAGDPSFAPWSSAFTYQDGRIDFRAGSWSPEQSGVTQAARTLARRLNARVFGEDDEEYSTETAV